jgi:hypothetical protein
MTGRQSIRFSNGAIPHHTDVNRWPERYRREVDFQKLGPALIIASSLVVAIRTARWPPTHSDGLANMEWEKEIEHSVRIAKIVLSHVTARCPEMFQMKDVPWYVATDDEVPR